MEIGGSKLAAEEHVGEVIYGGQNEVEDHQLEKCETVFHSCSGWTTQVQLQHNFPPTTPEQQQRCITKLLDNMYWQLTCCYPS